MHIRSKAGVEPFAAPHGEVVYELLGHAAGGAAQHSLAHIELPPGQASRKHYHPQAEESYYILSGTARLVIDSEERLLQAGEAVAITPSQVHQIFNDGAEALHFLAVCAPAWTPDNSVYLD